MGSYKPDILLPDDKRDSGVLFGRLAAQARIVVFVGFGFHPPNMLQLPFGPSADPNVRYFSINPIPPPSNLIIGKRRLRHIKGTAEQAMADFLGYLTDGKLLTDEVPEARFPKYGREPSTDEVVPADYEQGYEQP